MFYGTDLFYSDSSESKSTSLGKLRSSHGVAKLVPFFLPNKSDTKRQMQNLGTTAVMLCQ